MTGGSGDDEFREPSRWLIEQCASGQMTLVMSSVTEMEQRAAPRAVRKVAGALGDLPEVIDATTGETRGLADRYIESRAVSKGMRSDALHIAAATVAGVDVLASWNVIW